MEDFTDQNSPEPEANTNPPPAKPSGKPKTFKCPSCAGTVDIRAVGITINAVCRSCSSVIDVTNENYRIVNEAHKRIRETSLEIGNRGRFQGITWEVIGYTEKTDGSGQYGWEEYLLYNPYYGFRFLVQSSGHWSFVKVLRQDVIGTNFLDEVWFDDKKFSIFLRDKAIVKYVKGEFYWRVKKGETTSAIDYISPPYMLSVEGNAKEINVSLGEYIDRNDVAEAFEISPSLLPPENGVAPNQPGPYQGRLGKILWVTAFAIFGVFAVQVFGLATSDNVQVYTTWTSVAPHQKDQTFGTPPFNLPKDSNVFIRSTAMVENDWVELRLSLVNDKTHQEYAVTQAIEYYKGYEDGESWSEGSQHAETFLSKIPSGDYRLLVDTDAGAFQYNLPANFLLEVKRDVLSWSNFWFTFLLLIIYPVFALFKHWRFETKRWAESDYAPELYKSGEEDE